MPGLASLYTELRRAPKDDKQHVAQKMPRNALLHSICAGRLGQLATSRRPRRRLHVASARLGVAVRAPGAEVRDGLRGVVAARAVGSAAQGSGRLVAAHGALRAEQGPALDGVVAMHGRVGDVAVARVRVATPAGRAEVRDGHARVVAAAAPRGPAQRRRGPVAAHGVRRAEERPAGLRARQPAEVAGRQVGLEGDQSQERRDARHSCPAAEVCAPARPISLDCE
mmetsp:Transcript_3980/g.8986  ORF Transcript_3980/g.8986 Transcript_3980/m.8986 type:complete len:225 (-) Transcript_3980:29-703(-)